MTTPHPTLLALRDEIAAGLMVRGGYTLTEELCLERAANLAARLDAIMRFSFRPDVCACCYEALPDNDRLPFGPGRNAHAACVMDLQTKEMSHARR